jgi:hypothetical protein
MKTEVWPTEKLTSRGIHILSMSACWADRLPSHKRLWFRLRTLWTR